MYVPIDIKYNDIPYTMHCSGNILTLKVFLFNCNVLFSGGSMGGGWGVAGCITP